MKQGETKEAKTNGRMRFLKVKVPKRMKPDDKFSAVSADLQGIDVVRLLQLVQLLLNVGNHLRLEARAAQQVKSNPC